MNLNMLELKHRKVTVFGSARTLPDEPSYRAAVDFGHAMAQKNPEEYLAKDFTTLMETMALSSGMKLESENKQVPTGLE